MQKFSFLLFFLIILSTNLYSQEIDLGFNEVRQGDRYNKMGEKTSSILSVLTKSEIMGFIEKLNQDFGESQQVENKFIWENIEFKKLSKVPFKVILEVQITPQNKYLTGHTGLSFYVMSPEGDDLLNSKNEFQKRFKDYLQQQVDLSLKKK
jgi:hypothetical protein